MLPYLAFAGPVTVLMGLLNAQGRFALTAFSPLLFNIALIAAIATLLVWHADATFARVDAGGHRRRRRAAAARDAAARSEVRVWRRRCA